MSDLYEHIMKEFPELEKRIKTLKHLEKKKRERYQDKINQKNRKHSYCPCGKKLPKFKNKYCPECGKERHNERNKKAVKVYYQKNKEKIKIIEKIIGKKNKEKINKERRERYKRLKLLSNN